MVITEVLLRCCSDKLCLSELSASPIPWAPFVPSEHKWVPGKPSVSLSATTLLFRGTTCFCGDSDRVSAVYLLNVVFTYIYIPDLCIQLMRFGTFQLHASLCLLLAISCTSCCLHCSPPSTCPSKSPNSLTLITCLEVDTNMFPSVFGVLGTS